MMATNEKNEFGGDKPRRDEVFYSYQRFFKVRTWPF